MFENMSPIILHQINGAAYCCLASGMEPRAFAHSAVTDYLHDACLRIAPDGTVQEFYLNETVTFFNTETGRDGVGIVLPLREAQPVWLVPIRRMLLPVRSAIRRRFFVQRLYYESYIGFFLTLSQRINDVQ